MAELRIIVCTKQVPDPEMPASCYRIDTEARRVIPVGIPPVISPFDENALEAGIRLREAYGGKVTAVSVGYRLSKAVLRKALSAGADELIIVDDSAFNPEALDGYGTAVVLSKAIEKTGMHHLILTGRQAADTNAGVVGLYLAELLGIPAVTLARKITAKDGKAIIERVLPDGHEVVETRMPAVITVSPEIGELRTLRLRDVREAKDKPVLTWNANDVRLETKPENELALRELIEPKRQRACYFIKGETPAKSAKMLAIRLIADKIV
jgi:electron transfer flavoprotein beta subunit